MFRVMFPRHGKRGCFFETTLFCRTKSLKPRQRRMFHAIFPLQKRMFLVTNHGKRGFSDVSRAFSLFLFGSCSLLEQPLGGCFFETTLFCRTKSLKPRQRRMFHAIFPRQKRMFLVTNHGKRGFRDVFRFLQPVGTETCPNICIEICRM